MNKTINTILPGQTLGLIGGGQLGQMFTLAAIAMGYKVVLLEPQKDCPCNTIVNRHIVAQYDDRTALNELANSCDVVTTEFENVNADAIEYLENKIAVYPNSYALRTAQNRNLEKTFFNQLGIATTKFALIDSKESLQSISSDLFPGILKTNTLGYDGKGQINVDHLDELESAWNKLNCQVCILEKKVPLAMEASIVVARNDFETKSHPIAQNIHKNAILHLSSIPCKIDQATSNYITQSAHKIADGLNYIGVLAVEFFIASDGQILANEMAPRPHNSGHYTQDACFSSQFEQQVRSICNLKLGNPNAHSHAIMLNLLGETLLKPNFNNNLNQVLSTYDNLKLHLYGKSDAKIGRKMGHINLIGNELNQLNQQMSNLISILEI